MKYTSNTNAPTVSSIKLQCYATARIGEHTYRATPSGRVMSGMTGSVSIFLIQMVKG